MWDGIVLGMGVAFAVLTWLLLALCDGLTGGRS